MTSEIFSKGDYAVVVNPDSHVYRTAGRVIGVSEDGTGVDLQLQPYLFGSFPAADLRKLPAKEPTNDLIDLSLGAGLLEEAEK